MSKIVKIEELDNFENEGKYSFSSGWDGFKITLTDKEILLLIDNGQCCCEDFGTIVSDDNFEEFIGAEVRDIETTELDEDDYKTKSWLSEEFAYVDVLECGFVSLQTSRGKLQFAVYNHHNGYYGHNVRIEVKDL